MDYAWGLIGGLMIGSAGAIYLLGNGLIMGVSGILGGLVDGSARVLWRTRGTFLLGLVAVPAVLQMAGVITAETRLTDNAALIALAGVLVGLGTRIGNGCTSGHGVCGISRLSPRGIVATGVYIAAGAVTVLVMRSMLGGL